MTPPRFDYDEAIEVADGVWWVGAFVPHLHLQCSAYLVVHGERAVLLDPGAPEHFPKVMRKVLDLVHPSAVTAVVVAHQDPDVVGSLPILERVCNAPMPRIVSHLNTMRLLQHLGLQSPLVSAESLNMRLELDSGRVLHFIPTPFLHSPGAMATWDPLTGTLFTGDIFGFVGLPSEWTLYDPVGFPHVLDGWHRTYMSTRRALRPFLDTVEQLAPKRLCPQHGSILEGPQVQAAIDHLRTLDCGIDLLYGDAEAG